MEINNPVSFGESLLVMVVGIAVVFVGLVILIALIKVLAMVTENMGKKKAVKAAPAPAPAPAPVAPAPVVEETVADDDALIAVITAAVACMMEQGTGFTVRRVRRINSAPAWQKAGREEQIYSHF